MIPQLAIVAIYMFLVENSGSFNLENHVMFGRFVSKLMGNRWRLLLSRILTLLCLISTGHLSAQYTEGRFYIGQDFKEFRKQIKWHEWNMYYYKTFTADTTFFGVPGTLGIEFEYYGISQIFFVSQTSIIQENKREAYDKSVKQVHHLYEACEDLFGLPGSHYDSTTTFNIDSTKRRVKLYSASWDFRFNQNEVQEGFRSSENAELYLEYSCSQIHQENEQYPTTDNGDLVIRFQIFERVPGPKKGMKELPDPFYSGKEIERLSTVLPKSFPGNFAITGGYQKVMKYEGIKGEWRFHFYQDTLDAYFFWDGKESRSETFTRGEISGFYRKTKKYKKRIEHLVGPPVYFHDSTTYVDYYRHMEEPKNLVKAIWRNEGIKRTLAFTLFYFDQYPYFFNTIEVEYRIEKDIL